MTTLTMRKMRGVYVLNGHDAQLQTGWTMRRGEIRVDGRVWTVTPTDRHRIGVCAHAEHGVAVRLDPRQSHVPGPGGPVRWEAGRNRAVLARDGNRISVRTGRRSARIEVTGSWPELELVALTACFALMTRRRLRTLTIIAIVGATGHGPVG
jgi:hypothetical protein